MNNGKENKAAKATNLTDEIERKLTAIQQSISDEAYNHLMARYNKAMTDLKTEVDAATKREEYVKTLEADNAKLAERVGELDVSRNACGDQLDLVRDELKRIKATIIAKGMESELSEVIGICDRGQNNIARSYSVIREAEALRAENKRLSAFAEEVHARLVAWDRRTNQRG